eukprot:1160491-Pelagomonas_calceolata.AAC.5
MLPRANALTESTEQGVIEADRIRLQASAFKARLSESLAVRLSTDCLSAGTGCLTINLVWGPGRPQLQTCSWQAWCHCVQGSCTVPGASVLSGVGIGDDSNVWQLAGLVPRASVLRWLATIETRDSVTQPRHAKLTDLFWGPGSSAAGRHGTKGQCAQTRAKLTDLFWGPGSSAAGRHGAKGQCAQVAGND